MRNRLRVRLVAISKAAEVDQEEKDRAIANAERMMIELRNPDRPNKGSHRKAAHRRLGADAPRWGKWQGWSRCSHPLPC